MQFMKQVEPRFCNPLRPIVVCELITLRFLKRRRAIASLLFGNQGVYGTLTPKDLLHEILY